MGHWYVILAIIIIIGMILSFACGYAWGYGDSLEKYMKFREEQVENELHKIDEKV